jgi:hypothetical protein
MKKLIATIATIATFTSFGAQADGFRCLTTAGDLKVSVYNMVDPSEGTRSPAKMIVSDPSISEGRKTIAKFSAANGTLETSHNESSGLRFEGIVDLRFSDLSRGGEYLLGTRLAEVDTIRLYVDFVYGDNLLDGDETRGAVTLIKRNGEISRHSATCTRYLKN